MRLNILWLILGLTACGTREMSKEDLAPEVKEIASFLASNITHGDRDNIFPLSTLIAKIERGDRLSITCGTTMELAGYYFNKANIPWRRVSTITLDQWNEYDNGHSLLEIYHLGRWITLDIDNNVYPRLEGRLANIIEWSRNLDKVELVPLSDDEEFDEGWAYYDQFTRDGWNLRDWYKRNFQAVFIFQDYKAFISGSKNAEILSYEPKSQPIEEEEFMQTYYR